MLLMSVTWRTDFDKAQSEAQASGKYILLKFSGSDWCIPCIRMEKNIFSTAGFTQFADSNLVTVNADFPQKKKNMPSREVTKQNDLLASKYNKEGHFPLTLLLSPDGKVVRTWDGFPDGTPEDFKAQVRASCTTQ